MIALQITSMKKIYESPADSGYFRSFPAGRSHRQYGSHRDGRRAYQQGLLSRGRTGEDCIPWDLQSWSKIKGLCFDLIKGKHTPLYFKFVLHMQPDKAASMLEKAQVDPGVIRALVLNIRYDGEKTVLTTGCAYQVFTMDKSADTAWDKALKKYLDLKGISYEEL